MKTRFLRTDAEVLRAGLEERVLLSLGTLTRARGRRNLLASGLGGLVIETSIISDPHHCVEAGAGAMHSEL